MWSVVIFRLIMYCVTRTTSQSCFGWKRKGSGLPWERETLKENAMRQLKIILAYLKDLDSLYSLGPLKQNESTKHGLKTRGFRPSQAVFYQLISGYDLRQDFREICEILRKERRADPSRGKTLEAVTAPEPNIRFEAGVKNNGFFPSVEVKFHSWFTAYELELEKTT